MNQHAGAAERDRPEASRWHVDKRVPLALIITILAQTMAVIWGASNLWTRVSELERQMQVAAPNFERLIRLETKVDTIGGSVAEIRTMMSRREPRP
jgi:hypothetical protein